MEYYIILRLTTGIDEFLLSDQQPGDSLRAIFFVFVRDVQNKLTIRRIRRKTMFATKKKRSYLPFGACRLHTDVPIFGAYIPSGRRRVTV